MCRNAIRRIPNMISTTVYYVVMVVVLVMFVSVLWVWMDVGSAETLWCRRWQRE